MIHQQSQSTINNPNYQPKAHTLYPPNAGPTYGTITPWVKPSRVLYQIYQHPLPGQQTVFIESESSPSNPPQSPMPSALEAEEIEAAPLPPLPLTEELPEEYGSSYRQRQGDRFGITYD